MSSQVRDVYGIKVLKNKNPIVKSLRRQTGEPTLYGDQIWQSSYMLMDFLQSHGGLGSQEHVMDIGCGWGLLGIFCAKQYQAYVTSVDADSNVFPYVESHQELNAVYVKTLQAKFGDINQQQLIGQDVVMGADICFWPELTTQLRQLIHMSMDSGVRKVLIADPGRHTFHQLADYCSYNFSTKLHKWRLPGRTKFVGYVLEINRAEMLSVAV